MEEMLYVAFDDELKACEGSHALQQLGADGSIAIHSEAVITKNAGATVTVKESEGDSPIGMLAGSIGDLHVAGVDGEFLDEAAGTLTPGRYAAVSEEWVTAVDTRIRMEALSVAASRTAKKSFEDEQRAKDVAALHAEIDQLKAEHARARADRRERLQAKMDELDAKLQAKLDQAKQRSLLLLRGETWVGSGSIPRLLRSTTEDQRAKLLVGCGRIHMQSFASRPVRL